MRRKKYMRTEVLTLLGTLLVGAFASSAYSATSVCGAMVGCGSYTQAPDARGMSLEIKLVPSNKPNEVLFAWIVRKHGDDTGDGINLIMKFQRDGSFVATQATNGSLYAAGICRQMGCSYGITPILQKDGTMLTQTGTFRFEDNKLEISIFAPNLKDGDFTSKGTLTKR